jgi:hypothetical protein
MFSLLNETPNYLKFVLTRIYINNSERKLLIIINRRMKTLVIFSKLSDSTVSFVFHSNYVCLEYSCLNIISHA